MLAAWVVCEEAHVRACAGAHAHATAKRSRKKSTPSLSPPHAARPHHHCHAHTTQHAPQKSELARWAVVWQYALIQWARREPRLDPLAASLLNARELALVEDAPIPPQLVEHRLHEFAAELDLVHNRVCVRLCCV